MSFGLLGEGGRNAQLFYSMKSEVTTLQGDPGSLAQRRAWRAGKGQGDRKVHREVIGKLSLLEEDILGGR